MLENIAFSDYRKKDDIHGTALYPAVMVAPVQKDILTDILESNDITSIFDPFHGSGTALYEAMEIVPGIHLVGCDINPLANLLTRVKLQGINYTKIDDDIRYIQEYIETPYDIELYAFPNMHKWFRDDIATSIGILRSAIMKIEDDQNRLYFWYILCDVIRKYSNTRSSTYKLHMKELAAISRMVDTAFESFIAAAQKHKNKFIHCTENYILYKCDVLTKMKDFQDNLFDISITSPPYGDNGTTVPYGQFSMLALYTIPERDLDLEGWELDSYSKIDWHSMGGRDKGRNLDDLEYALLWPYLTRISVAKHKKIIRFFCDYFAFLKDLCRVTDKYIVMTLGNRTVDRVQIDLVDITIRYLECNEFRMVKCAEREIPKKRTPKKTSSVYHKPVSSMNSEYVIVHKRII